MSLLKEFFLIQILNALLIACLIIDEDCNVQVRPSANHCDKGWNLVCPSDRCDGPLRAQTYLALTLKKSRYGLDVQKVGNTFDDETIRTDKKSLMNFVTKSSLKRKETILCGLKDFGNNFSPFLFLGYVV